MTDPVWKQASLPVAKGGLGLRRAEEIALSTYLASISSAEQLVTSMDADFDLDELCAAELTSWMEVSGTELPLAALRIFQRTWDLPIVERNFSEVQQASSLTEKARMVAVSTKESGAWLNALPASCLGNLLDDDSLRISIGLRLGAPICEPHTCRCSVTVDVYGRHGLSCRYSAGRHSALNESLRRALVTCQSHAVLDPNGVVRRHTEAA
ncbi:hypothetical protein RvY_12120 [Ramazzottius varieornatus]|uniref:Uncharacterized protein n=1 Tax=Ramazzottius varieornatus TaxID=947166 RepID=A0A1D1VIH0_RAMVA|nr:hypothetical protein RvY_12120 [Ramazzottius varieornatus]